MNERILKYWNINKVGSNSLPSPQLFSCTFTYPALPNAGLADAGTTSGYSTFVYDGTNWSSFVTTSSTNTTTIANPVSSYGSFQLAVGNANLSVWNGLIDNQWFNSSNWNCGLLPNSSLDTYIPNGMKVFF